MRARAVVIGLIAALAIAAVAVAASGGDKLPQSPPPIELRERDRSVKQRPGDRPRNRGEGPQDTKPGPVADRRKPSNVPQPSNVPSPLPPPPSAAGEDNEPVPVRPDQTGDDDLIADDDDLGDGGDDSAESGASDDGS